MNKLQNNTSLSDKGNTAVELHTEPFPRPTSKELYEAYTDKLSSTFSTLLLLPQQTSKNSGVMPLVSRSGSALQSKQQQQK